VVVLSDDLGYADLGCFGHPVIQTPNLDRLAQEGMKLTACYAAAPVCSPARAGMLTGRTPSRSGITDWIPAGSPMHLRRNEVTIAALLRQVGYATCHVGKWHCNGLFNRPEQPQPGDHGFDHWFSTQNNAAPSHRNPTNFIRNGQAVGPLTGYSSALIAQEAIEWLKGLPPKRPFCLFVWFHAPHEPIAAADEFTRLYPNATQPGEAEYCGDVTQMDHEVGRLLQALDGLKRRENTLVFFTSDNGPETLRRYRGAERSHGSPGPLRGMKLHLYEGGIRVPGILSWPGKTRPGQVCHEPVCGLDVLPTFCAMAGATVPTDRALDGASILPLFEGKPVERKTPLYWQYDHALGKPKVALRDGDWKLLAHADLKTFELYHLADDPAEKHDLAAQKPDLCRALAAKLLKLHADVQAERPTWPEAPSKKK
jgi:arylsulfatase A